MSSGTEDTPEAGGEPPPTANGRRPGWLSAKHLIWPIVVLAALQSIAALKLVMDGLYPGGIVPGILLLSVIGLVWLAAVWVLVVLAAFFRGGTLRLVALALLTGANIWCIPIFADEFQSLTTVPPDIETGQGYFDAENDRALVVAIRNCDPALMQSGAVCALDKVETLARTTDIYAIGEGNESQMSLALQNGPNPNVIRILLRTAKPPDEVVEGIYSRAGYNRDLPLLRAGLDGGLDPNYQYPRETTPGDTYLSTIFGWDAGMAALLDAGASVDQTDRDGNTLLMQALHQRRYDVAAFLLAHGAATDRIAADGTTSVASLVEGIPPEDREKLPPAFQALVARDRGR